MEYKDAIADVVNNLLSESGRTATSLAESCGVSKQSVFQWRRGQAAMTVDKVPLICDFFGITPTDFFSRVEYAYMTLPKDGD